MKKFKRTIIFISMFSVLLIIFGGFYFYVTKVEGRSVQSKFVENYLKINGGKDKFVISGKVTKYIKQRKVENAKPYHFPTKLKLKSRIVKKTENGMEIFYINSKEKTNEKQILYLHGGAYINQPTVRHWTFLDKIARKTDAAVILPIYPKAPNHEYKVAFDKTLHVYEKLLEKTDAKDITIMGDSAGGSFSLALSQVLLDKGLPQPGNIILLSPWLDITMQNIEIPELEKQDPMLGAYGLVQIGKTWAGDTDPNYYMLSPINGELKGLGKISLFIGTHEIFLPDARKFRDMIEAQGISINYFEHEKMNHVFPVYPIPEAKRAQEQIIKIINE